ncbi:hypothetical protein JKF63_06499 [Porcisia hertigi]|uniref:sn-1-specific diacylglycerol lipase n=1 Tax=Porcisia hertigi TaxID=2761500 RepID=A0A836IXJ5_9TRYP|nr:hypothetical protein JKF63_06499 [Porcisia hertigi]
MPSLVWFGRAWRVGTDDFAFSSILHSILLSVCAAFVAHQVNITQVSFLDGCDNTSPALGHSMMWFVGVNMVSSVLFACTAVFSLRGGVFEVSKRKAVPFMLYINTACTAVIFMVACVCAKRAIFDAEIKYCKNAFTRHILCGAIVLNLFVVLLYVGPFLVAFDPSGSRVYHNSSDYVEVWWKRFRVFCCNRGKQSQGEDAYLDLAQVFANAFRGYDIVPSDIAAGILLLHGYQLRSRRLIAGTVNYGPNPKGYHERLSSQAMPALRLTHEQRAWVRELQEYSRFFIASYGWLLFEFQHLGTGLARLCCLDPCMYCRHHPGQHIGQRCFCDVTALLHETGLSEEDLLLTSWNNGVFEPVHYVAYDENSDAVVIAIRGSMSIEDCITDFSALPFPLMLQDTPPGVPSSEYYAHGGMVRCAHYVLENLCNHGILQQIVRGRFVGKKLVVLGHSLGAGVALVLSAILWSDHVELRNRLRCLAYAPPGGTVSKALMEYQRDFVAAACMGYDIVPRLAQHTFDSFREAIFDVLAASCMNKNIIFMNILRTVKISKDFHPFTSPESQGRRSAESTSYRELLRHTPCTPTRETQKLYNCSRMIHFIKVVEVCTPSWCIPGCWRYNEEVYIPVVCDFEAVQVVLASPTMLVDHFPDRLYRVMQRSMEQLDRGELDRFYADNLSDLAPCLQDAPMHYVGRRLPT